MILFDGNIAIGDRRSATIDAGAKGVIIQNYSRYHITAAIATKSILFAIPPFSVQKMALCDVVVSIAVEIEIVEQDEAAQEQSKEYITVNCTAAEITDGLDVMAQVPAFVQTMRIDDLSGITLNYDQITGGTATIGGADNGNGAITVLTQENDVIAELDKDGTYVRKLMSANQVLYQDATVGNFGPKPYPYNIFVYVDATNGDDANDGTSSAPLATIEEALRRIPTMTGGTIYLKTGTYGYYSPPPIGMRTTLTISTRAPIAIAAVAGETATLQYDIKIYDARVAIDATGATITMPGMLTLGKAATLDTKNTSIAVYSMEKSAQYWIDGVRQHIIDADTLSNKAITDILPVGSVWQYAGADAPNGWLICDGAAISRTTYAALFSVIGTTYGAGDGSTTFNLPDMRGRVAVGYAATQTEFDQLGKTGGEKTHTLTSTEMPSHTHVQNSHNHTQEPHFHYIYNYNAGGNTLAYSVPTLDGAKGYGSNWRTQDQTATNQPSTATNQNTGGGNSHNNLQPYITTQFIIKY